MTGRRRAAAPSWRAASVIAVSTLLAAVLLGMWSGPRVHHPSSGTAAAAATGTPADQGGPQQRQQPQALVPVRLEIPAIALETPVVRLGLLPDRTVEVPAHADDAGWFQRGPTPGRHGSAVILGHVDSPGGPAVFARLQELRPGDAVTVERADGSTVPFVVTRSMMYDNAQFPADRVYAAPDGRRLNLVTCGGTYDSTRGGYQSNLVVYTRQAHGPRFH